MEKPQRGKLSTKTFMFSRPNCEPTCCMETQKRALVRPKMTELVSNMDWCSGDTTWNKSLSDF